MVHLPMGRFAEARGDRPGRALPGQRRVVVRHRLDLPRRRRPLRRLRHARSRPHAPGRRDLPIFRGVCAVIEPGEVWLAGSGAGVSECPAPGSPRSTTSFLGGRDTHRPHARRLGGAVPAARAAAARRASTSCASTSSAGSAGRRATGRSSRRCRSASTRRSGSTTTRFDSTRHVVAARPPRPRASWWTSACPRRCPATGPLWQIWIADRLDDGRIGVVGKAHHCMVDGIAAVELAALLLDPSPTPSLPRRRWRAAPAPGPAGATGRRDAGPRPAARCSGCACRLRAIAAAASPLLRRDRGARGRGRLGHALVAPTPVPRPERADSRRRGTWRAAAAPARRTSSGSDAHSTRPSTTSILAVAAPGRAPPARAAADEPPVPAEDDGARQRAARRRGRRARQPDLVHVRGPSLRRAGPDPAPAAWSSWR